MFKAVTVFLLAFGALFLPGVAPSATQDSISPTRQPYAQETPKRYEPAGILEKACGFDSATMSFLGTPVEQAKCLLRPVKMYGHLGEPLKTLPQPLEALVGQNVAFDKERLRSYLRQKKIAEVEIGGVLDEPVSRALDNRIEAPFASYFVIHDVSTPNYLDENWPGNINEKSWEWNDLAGKWLNKKVAHIFINRLGESATAIEFKTAWRATKLEVKILGEISKGLFVHAELVQPRRRDPNGSPTNDALAPNPGFTEAQLDRLALVYTAASLRRGTWMIPAYHAAIDAGIADAHDDPQNFDLNLWANCLANLLRVIQPPPDIHSR